VDPLCTAAAALKAGARVLHYRGKGKPGVLQWREAAELRGLTRGYGADLIINDRPDIAFLVDADGLHLGQKDLPFQAARSLVGSKKVIGVTAHTVQEAQEAEREGADYVGFGTVFVTNSKEGVAVAGLKSLAEVVRRLEIPVIGIGGISRLNLVSVMETGVTGVAVLSAVSEAPDPGTAVRQLRDRIDRYDPGSSGVCNGT
jgi:thiamine-phosphate pyrophosphorylase